MSSDQRPERPDTRTLGQKLEPFIRRRRLMVIVVVAITALAYWHFSSQPHRYTATTEIYAPSAGPAAVVGSDPETDPNRRLLNEAAVLQSPAVAAKVATGIGYGGDARDLLKQISVAPSSDSDFLSLSATTSDAKQSANLANAFASAFVVLSERNAGRSKSAVRVISTATVPPRANGASPKRNAIFAAVLGVVLAGMLVLGLEAFDRRIRHSLVETEYGLPLLASIPFSRRAHSAALSGPRMPSTVMERIRDLRTMLGHVTGPVGAPRSLLVTSAIPQEGKSTLVKGLALAWFESGKSVLVIDADLRRGTLHEFFEAPLVPGLADVLRSEIPVSEAVHEVDLVGTAPAVLTAAGLPSDAVTAPSGVSSPPVRESSEGIRNGTRRTREGTNGAGHGSNGNHDRRDGALGPVLHLLSSGSGTGDPAALLSGASMQTLIAEAGARYDIVLIDSPPMLAVNDSVPLAAAVDGVVVVARSGFTTREAAARCRQALDRIRDVTVLGVVANAVTDDFNHQYYADQPY